MNNDISNGKAFNMEAPIFRFNDYGKKSNHCFLFRKRSTGQSWASDLEKQYINHQVVNATVFVIFLDCITLPPSVKADSCFFQEKFA